MVTGFSAVVIIAAGLGFFALRTGSGLQSIHRLVASPERSRASWFYQWDRCIQDSLDRRVPAGARVYLDPVQQYWTQGLASFATPRLRIVARPANADYVLSVADVTSSTPASQRCGKALAPSPNPPDFPIGAQITLVVEPRR